MKLIFSMEKDSWRRKKRWLHFFHPVHILRYPEEDNGMGWNSFIALKHKEVLKMFSQKLHMQTVARLVSLSILILYMTSSRHKGLAFKTLNRCAHDDFNSELLR